MPAPARAFPQVVTVVHRAPGLDLAGADAQLEETGRLVCPANLQANPGREATANQDTQFYAWNAYLPTWAALGGRDQVVLGELVLEVDGPPMVVHDFDGRPHHIEAKLRRVV